MSDGRASTSAPAGTLLYSADWSSDLDGWTGNEDWAVSDGELLCRGQVNELEAGVVAPVEVDELDGYAVQAEIRLLRYEIGNGSFGAMVGLGGGGGRPTFDARPFLSGAGWHSYRIEVRGNDLAAYLDGAAVLSATDNTFPAGRVGLWSRGAQLVVRSFEVYELPAGPA